MAGNDFRLPNLLIVGVSRAGTTSLFTYLSRHPEICPSAVKEPHFFSPIRLGQKPAQSIEQYAANFHGCGAARYRLEATPVYFYGGRPVIEAITTTLPDVRAVVSLRNPVERLWSSYQYKLSRGRANDEGGFAGFVERCEQVLAAPPEESARAGSYRALITGRYADFIGEWFEELGPRFKVIFFDDLKREPLAVTSRLLEWLELDPALLPEAPMAAKNATVQPRNLLLHSLGLKASAWLGAGSAKRGRVVNLLLEGYKTVNMRRATAAMDPEMRRYLEGIFDEPNRRLATELVAHGYCDLPDWLNS